ncbi:phage minor capsid protein [Clostridium fessum]|uniref:phage minor capsid protein n=1 Tax=Clostridium fessum TaxID=2126740 RepID=UPI003AF12C83
MLEPDYFYGKSDVLISYEQELEDWILQDIAMRLLKAEAMAGTTDMELYKLRQLGWHQNEIVKRLSALTQKSTAEIRRLLQDAVLTSWDDDKSTLSRLGIDAVSPLENPVVMELLDAEFKKTLGEVNNLTRSTMMQSQRDLMNMLNEAEMRVAAGVQSYSAAVCDILDRYGKTGVMIDYPTGTRRTLEAAVRMCVVTSMNQTAAQVTNHYIAEHNVEYVLVSAHLGARTQGKGQPYLAGHDNWQGRCYKISGSEPDAPNLAEMTGYDIVNGTGHVLNPLGLHGYNCRHSHKPWNKSLRNPYLDENGNLKIDSEENRKVYELQQQQRTMERAIRQTKRQLLMKQAEIDSVAETDVKSVLQPEYDRLAYRLRTQNQKYKQFCVDNGLQTQADRIKVAGFKRAQSAKANGRATAYQNRRTGKAAHSVNTGAKVKYDENRTYRIDLESYDENINDSLSTVAKELAKLGDADGFEHSVFVDLNTGEIGRYVTDRLPESVVPDYPYLKKHSNVAFLHNHNVDTELSFPDVGLMVNETEINVVAAVRNDGIITLVESNGMKNSAYLPLEYEELRKKIEMDMLDRDGYIDPWKVEIALRDKAIKEYAKNGMKTYGEKI